MEKKSQYQQVIEHLCKYGTISSWEAIQKYHITRLSQYILMLRKEGVLINDNKQYPKDKNWYVIYELQDQAIDMQSLLNKKRLDTANI
jgi:hypothetical protein